MYTSAPHSHRAAAAPAHSYDPGSSGPVPPSPSGGPGGASSISSSKKGSEESCCDCLIRFALAPFRALAWVVRKLICCCTLGYCCNDATKFDPKAVKKDAEKLIEKMQKCETKKARGAHFDAFVKAHPNLKDQMIQAAIDIASEEEEFKALDKDERKLALDAMRLALKKGFDSKSAQFIAEIIGCCEEVIKEQEAGE